MYVQWKWNKAHFKTNINIKDSFINDVSCLSVPELNSEIKNKSNRSSVNLEPTNIHFPMFADRVEWLGWASRLWDLISNDSPSGWLVRMCLQYLRPEEWHLQWQSVSVVRHPNTSHTHSIHWIDSQQRIDDDDDDQQINLQEESFKKQTNQPTQTCPIQTRKEDKSWAKMMDGFPVQII
jgi:hypothetical protein